MTGAHESLQAAVIRIVAETFDRDPSTVTRSSSLIDDLGAESIDFLDLVFRIEKEFGITVPEDALWLGRVGRGEADLPAEIAALRARLPEFRWDRFTDPVTARDLPRLITVHTIVDYLERRGVSAPERSS